MENNKLIAEFMGYFAQDRVNDDGWKGWWSSSNQFPNHPSEQIMFGGMKFDTSWDWLMPVVKQIQELPNSVDSIERDTWFDYMQECLPFADIENVYMETVIFIKWYNENKPPNNNQILGQSTII